MISRRARVRSTIGALLAALIGLWLFAGYFTVASGMQVWSVAVLDQRVGTPIAGLVSALQDERRSSAGALDPAALDRARAATDQARTELDRGRAGTLARWASSAELDAAMATLDRALASLPATRVSVDSGRGAEDAYTSLIADVSAVDDQLPQPGPDGTTAIGLARATELLAQEDTTMTAMLATGSADPTQAARFGLLVRAQRDAFDELIGRLSDRDRAGYQQARASSALTGLENAALSRPDQLAFTAPQWRAAADAAMSRLRGADRDLRAQLRDQLGPRTMVILGQLVMVIALGLVAVFAWLNISIVTVRRLRTLRDAADDLAVHRLPGLVDRLGRGERVDVTAEAPPLESGRDEIGRVGAAFNRVQETAVRIAIEQAELRQGVREVFLSLARRSQSLLHRQLGLLDAMERQATTPQALAELFRVDHLATRMRRNAENLIVLSGASAGRTWRKRVPMVDVMRAALAEVEDYSRVSVRPPASAALVGPAVGDVIHLLAELVENAVSFSPPQTVVRVTGAAAGDAFVVEVEDRGLGMADEQRAVANAALRTPPEFPLNGTAQLGLYVVARLAQRQGIAVELRESPYGGTTAVVTLPAGLVTVPPSAGQPVTEPVANLPMPLRPKAPSAAASTPATTAPSGLPVRQRSGALPTGSPAPGASPPVSGRGIATPLPGLSLRDEPDPDDPLWTPPDQGGR
jgi:signal transduction histidine kinase